MVLSQNLRDDLYANWPRFRYRLAQAALAAAILMLIAMGVYLAVMVRVANAHDAVKGHIVVGQIITVAMLLGFGFSNTSDWVSRNMRFRYPFLFDTEKYSSVKMAEAVVKNGIYMEHRGRTAAARERGRSVQEYRVTRLEHQVLLQMMF